MAPVLRGLTVFLGFVLLTVAMTWPWVTHVRDAAADAGDSNINSWILWWDYHQAFRDPLHLFDANIFFPAKRTLAFSEHNLGIALLFFPAFAAGLRPLTVHGLAVLLAFAFSGFGAWRLTKTLTGSSGAAWIAGIAFAFTPYRFHHLTHLNYMFAGWIPLVLDALVRFLKQRGRRQAAFLGLAFFMNGLTCTHWLVLTLVPLVATFLLVAGSMGILLERKLWTRSVAAVGAATLGLLPFLLPYDRVAREYGFVRSPQEALAYSATWIHWLTIDQNNKVWSNLGADGNPWERCLFPGLVILTLGFLGLLQRRAAGEAPPDPSSLRGGLLLLDLSATLAAGAALVGAGEHPFRISVGTLRLLSIGEPTRALVVLLALLALRLWITWTTGFVSPSPGTRTNANLVRRVLGEPGRGPGPGIVAIGLLWSTLGVAGSFGMTFAFHRFLFEHIWLFKAIRVPARWAMVAHLGLALLAGAGALALARHAPRRFPSMKGVVFVILGGILLFELRAAPLDLIHGEVDPDELALYLRETPMRGGLVELPATVEARHAYVLRAADHGGPLVDAVSGFTPPLAQSIERESAARPLRDEFLTLLEGIPTSFLVFHESFSTPEDVGVYREFLARGLGSGRLRFIRRFSDRGISDLYAVTRTEPDSPKAGTAVSPSPRPMSPGPEP